MCTLVNGASAYFSVMEDFFLFRVTGPTGPVAKNDKRYCTTIIITDDYGKNADL